MQNDNITLCATDNGWRPVPTRLLESRGLYSPPRLVHLREVQGEGPAAGSDDIFAEMATVATDSALEPPKKLAKLRKLIADAEKSLTAYGGDGSTSTTEGVVKRLLSKGRPQQLTEGKKQPRTMTTNEFVKRLKGSKI